MYIKRSLLLSILLSLAFLTHAQSVATISGYLKDAAGNPVPGASVKLQHHNTNAIADEKGYFRIASAPPGKHTLHITAVGFQKITHELNLKAGANQVVNLTLEQSVNDIEAVSVIGRSTVKEVGRQAYNVTAIDAKKLYNSTLDLSHALDRVSGIRVREDGGLGSRMNFSLNGFSGRQVKIFLDGVPMDNFGSSFQLNNIPINLAERVEVYKGVVPIWLGSDALGGAINIVTSNKQHSYLDVSYSYGSFNTHRSTINAGYTAKSGFTVQLNAFQNYSDNNYRVRVNVADLVTGEYYPRQWVRRFHDTYHNETVIANVGVVGKKYADKLLFGITMGKSYSELQTGARMVSVFGDIHNRGTIVMPSVKYQVKNIFVKGLDFSLTGNYNLGSEQQIDTVNRRYNWFRQHVPNNGAERNRTMYKFNNNNGIGTANLSYKLNERHSFALNDVYTTFNRKGKDPLYPNDEKYDHPKTVRKNVIGLGYKYDYNEKWNTSLFVKNYSQHVSFAESFNPTGNWGDVAYRKLNNDINKWGYGIATTYFVMPALQLKSSFEKSYRLPEAEELFGDVIGNLDGAPDLKPETSNNFNFGVSYQARIAAAHRLSVDANFLYRDAKDFIRPRLNANQTKQVNGNEAAVTNAGFDAEVRYSFKQLFTAGVNMTCQNLRNQTKFEDGQKNVSPLYRDRIPNMPYLFGNADASLFFKNVLKKGNSLTLGYNFLYVHEYYLSWPGQAEVKLTIPRQFCQDVNIVYSLANGRYNVALECKNLVDNKLYDNFSLQKPGRAFYGKFRYFISK
ncbi:Outer membrane receptor proteins, mostly Fe transport [Chitinophaga terrae (ex Kim and Jung 2007)]|uniref:Outer membrane receptor proteins, mostly Fe transport n=1 Tax=Chitinophaga terrae (ex Kim and Jung 2007) TaxID=408074 RepID=A0A1H4CGU2_9BACT|nr:TonB-dependent receptor [Chitinophaga terrae (ex Kim and Jung 2007)]GEP88970.1 TonB-dependent receptor [Chitinophaga terrae (ex Kim and Jung 2007)]SEA59645.1 Outer membrane receptor proteins, mostly Fe transport [Chitinophaga terrae (ex Kim and Jung 2007)]